MPSSTILCFTCLLKSSSALLASAGGICPWRVLARSDMRCLRRKPLAHPLEAAKIRTGIPMSRPTASAVR
ncbi:hypothetical protein PF005_g2299 [Phytophthora fragariae]|uniref:Secreted protein n=1 Tax=Phytophthora fragariae TaxID=53985 RepID=A0A6A4ACT9_9STRA|nr:hypothetical protein PF003_g13487 [Phytophthora fragariae]KAE8942044.1 hypothetical protein PF009_g8181 [Phytophthora fragariae]KAE8982178.1 hypothetical protein PF011_g21721 [Phytophthora fragariae]KAE9136178.1 hypothetical protein PF007_g2279 [Phytophthora fragariae]KAE9154046.1 hypothetical protein PF006_g1885 [Phytophthora fragariae]